MEKIHGPAIVLNRTCPICGLHFIRLQRTILWCLTMDCGTAKVEESEYFSLYERITMAIMKWGKDEK